MELPLAMDNMIQLCDQLGIEPADNRREILRKIKATQNGLDIAGRNALAISLAYIPRQPALYRAASKVALANFSTHDALKEFRALV